MQLKNEEPGKDITKLRILCLHGYGTNKEFLKFQMRDYIKKFEDSVEFVYANGSFEVDLDTVHDRRLLQVLNNLSSDKKIFSWLSLKTFPIKISADNVSILESNYQEPLENLIKIIRTLGPFDGFLGFSQGGSLLHMLSNILEINKEKYADINPKFILFFSSFTTNFAYLNFWKHSSFTRIPTIHIFGYDDPLYERSIYLTTFFKDPWVITHSEGHKFPILSEEIFRNIKAFLNSCQLKNQNIIKQLKPLL